jgi:transposase
MCFLNLFLRDHTLIVFFKHLILYAHFKNKIESIVHEKCVFYFFSVNVIYWAFSLN